MLGGGSAFTKHKDRENNSNKKNTHFNNNFTFVLSIGGRASLLAQGHSDVLDLIRR